MIVLWTLIDTIVLYYGVLYVSKHVSETKIQDFKRFSFLQLTAPHESRSLDEYLTEISENLSNMFLGSFPKKRKKRFEEESYAIAPRYIRNNIRFAAFLIWSIEGV